MQAFRPYPCVPQIVILVLTLSMTARAVGQPGPIPGGEFHLYTSAAMTTPGLVGSYINTSLRTYASQDDWRVSQQISGTRVDPSINFTSNDWGGREALHLTGGSSSDWDNFSVQWDGYVQILTPGMRLATISDDSSRMWIDLNGDGSFGSTTPELIDNHWGSQQAPTRGDLSVPLPVGVYRIRIQYQEDFFGNTMQLFSPPPETVRVAYVIPSNRVAQPGAVQNIQSIVQQLKSWCCEQMDRCGQGARSFHYETEADGVTPRVYVTNVSQTDSFLRQDVWNNTITAAQGAGVPVWADGQVWLLIPECHLEMPDGSIIGGVALGAGYGSGSGGGVAMIGAEKLSFSPLSTLRDDSAYAGRVVPGIGPYPLVNAVSFPGFEGSTMSSIESSMIGAAMHEMGHAFGAAHDTRNDGNFHGNLMFNGLRGIRGAIDPDRYALDDTDMSEALAREFGVSRFFAPCDGSPGTSQQLDGTSPAVTSVTTGSVATVGGQVAIGFHAEDTGGLALALLRLDGNTVGELPLVGTSGDWSILTPFFTPGQANNFSIAVFDVSGNQTGVSTSVIPNAGSNVAPRPFFQITRSHSRVGETIQLNASGSSDPDGSPTSLRFQWDVDGDGIFDTPLTSSSTLVTSYATGGNRLVRLRVVDAAGASVVSTWIAVRTDNGSGGLCYANCDASSSSPILNANDFQCFLNRFAAENPYANCDGSTAPPILNANDFQCFLNKFAAGCS